MKKCRNNCSEPGCKFLEHCKGLCKTHYGRMWRNGTTKPRPKAQDRINRDDDLGELAIELDKVQKLIRMTPMHSPEFSKRCAQKSDLRTRIEVLRMNSHGAPPQNKANEGTDANGKQELPRKET